METHSHYWYQNCQLDQQMAELFMGHRRVGMAHVAVFLDLNK